MIQPHDERQYYFDLVAQAAQHCIRRYGHAYAAPVKSELQRRSSPPFDEATLGFESFREFLRAARDSGAIRLQETEKDYEVLPPGANRTPAATSKMSKDGRRPGKIRPDMWKAFVDWSTNTRRVFDREENRVEIFDAEPSADEDPRVRELRQRVADIPSQYVPIEPITQQTTIEWMRAFAWSLREEAALQHALLDALDGEHGVRTFTELLRGRPAIRAWNAWRQDRVTETIEKWLDRHQLVGVPLHETPPVQSRGAPTPDASRAAQPEDDTLDRVRATVHRAVDHMSLGDLLKLSIPLEYTIKR